MKIGKDTAFPAVDDKHENLAPSTLVSLNRPLRTNALRLIPKKNGPHDTAGTVIVDWSG